VNAIWIPPTRESRINFNQKVDWKKSVFCSVIFLFQLLFAMNYHDMNSE